MRLIDADAFEVVAYKGIPEGYNDTFGDGVDWILTKIDTQPTIEERPKGEWIEVIALDEFGNPYPCGVRCSECGFCQVSLDNFCPNCGAKMKGKEKQ